MSRIDAFEELVLLAVLGLDGAGYGVSIREELEAETGETISLGAVYATLDRLERKGLVRSTVGPATPQRGGRRKRVFRVSATAAALPPGRHVTGRGWMLVLNSGWRLVPDSSRRGSYVVAATP